MNLAIKLYFNYFVIKFLVDVRTLFLIKVFYKRVKILLTIGICILLRDWFYIIYVIQSGVYELELKLGFLICRSELEVLFWNDVIYFDGDFCIMT